MVYSIRSNKCITTRKPLKTERVQGEHSKQVELYMRTHEVSIKDGKVEINTKG